MKHAGQGQVQLGLASFSIGRSSRRGWKNDGPRKHSKQSLPKPFNLFLILSVTLPNRRLLRFQCTRGLRGKHQSGFRLLCRLILGLQLRMGFRLRLSIPAIRSTRPHPVLLHYKPQHHHQNPLHSESKPFPKSPHPSPGAICPLTRATEAICPLSPLLSKDNSSSSKRSGIFYGRSCTSTTSTKPTSHTNKLSKTSENRNPTLHPKCVNTSNNALRSCSTKPPKTSTNTTKNTIYICSSRAKPPLQRADSFSPARPPIVTI